jgi:hypothetical protein
MLSRIAVVVLLVHIKFVFVCAMFLILCAILIETED